MRRIVSFSPLGALCIAVLCLASPVSAAKSHPGHAQSKPAPKRVVFKVPAGWPRTVSIPKIGVTANVESIALTKPADSHAPYRWNDVAWYDRGARPGDRGRAAVFGHVDSMCCPAVFYHLRDLKAGDIIEVRYKSGPILKFRVMWTQVYPNNKLPQSFLFGQTSERGLSLITCTGIYHGSGAGYDHKRVVYARVILPNGKLG